MRSQRRLMKLPKRLLMRRLLLTSLLIVGFAPIVHAQNSQDLNRPSGSTATSTSANSADSKQQDDPTAKALEQAINRLAVAEEKNRLLEEQLKAKDDRIAAKDERIQNLTDRIELMKANRADANTVITGDAVMLRACEQQLARSDAEIARLRSPGLFRSIFDTRTLTGAMVGFGLGRVTK